MGVLTIEEWNDLIDRINYLGAHLPGGCTTDSSTPPDPVTAPHQWSVSDITEAQNRLKDICPNAEFTTASPGDKWRQTYIDELNDVLDNASAEWCGCEEACCVPQGTGTVQINPGGYYVTIPFSQIVEQYLYGYVSYEDMIAAMGAEVVAHLEECVGGPTGQIIRYVLRHVHWTNCVYQDRWVDTGAIRQYGLEDEYWYTCSNSDTTVVDSGYVPALGHGAYSSSTSVGSTSYYDQPMGMGYYYDYAAGRWYETHWIGAFDVDVYVYDLYVDYVCPS